MRKGTMLLVAVLSICASVALEAGETPAAPGDSQVSYEEAFIDLYATLENRYPCFGLKGIDWREVGDELFPRARAVATDAEFGIVCMELVARLEDSHAQLLAGTALLPKINWPGWDPGFACLIDDSGRPVVYHVDRRGPAERAGVHVGMAVISIDGKDAAEALEGIMAFTRRYVGYSSARYLRYHAAQWLGRRMERGETVAIEFAALDGKRRAFELPATMGVRYLPRLPVPIPGIADSGDVSWKMLKGGIGYIYVRRIDKNLIPKLDAAVSDLSSAKGLIIDVRGNSGGGFDAGRALGNFDPDDPAEPARPRFGGPIALLIDARCISAGEGWASWFLANGRARLFGEATAGASARKTEYTLKNGLYKVRFPVKAYTGFLDRPIERRGLEPDVPVRQNAADLSAGRDTVLETAKAYLAEAAQPEATADGDGGNRLDVDETDARDSGLGSADARARLVKGRGMLKGRDKKTAEARVILLDLAERGASSLGPVDRAHLYAYLGYIEDLAGDRRAAIEWFRKAAAVRGPGTDAIRDLAKVGLRRSVTWIRHLDADSTSPPQRRDAAAVPAADIIERIGAGLVLRSQPGGLSPAKSLSLAERLENFDILAAAIDRYYSFFTHKGIDWPEVVARYRGEVGSTETADDFYRLLYRFIRELNDFHSWLCNYHDKPSLGRFSPGVITRRIDGRVVVTDVLRGSDAERAGLKRASEILSVDGLGVDEHVQRMKPLMHMYSSERCFLEQAYRQVLKGAGRSTAAIEFTVSPGAAPKRAALKRDIEIREADIPPDFPVERGKFIWYGKHPSGCGYIRILSFSGRMEVADEFDYALERLKGAPGLIIDVRENGGGFGTSQARIIGRLIKERMLVSISYKRNGPGHDDFSKRETYFEPCGRWQYAGPMALLTNAITGSATDLFVCRLKSTGRVVTVGGTTHGNLTGTCVYVSLPCGILARISTGYVSDAAGRIIEGNGNAPDVRAEPTIDDVTSGVDSVLERAAQELRRTGATQGLTAGR